MKTLVRDRKTLKAAGRWDIDYHLPAEGIRAFPNHLLKRIDQIADISKDKRDPTRKGEDAFQYIDIASVDVKVGSITNPQTLEGHEAPSRARKVVQAFDIIISTCRPTRGAIAVVPVWLHDEIASTGFSVIRPKQGVNPFYLHYALRLDSTLEQFRKWSTGSSYPAMLDADVSKTLVPVPDLSEQDRIAEVVHEAYLTRDREIKRASATYQAALDQIASSLAGTEIHKEVDADEIQPIPTDTASIRKCIEQLDPITKDEKKGRRKIIQL